MEQELYQLIYDARRGDRQAFAELVKQYKGTVFRHAYAMVNDRMEAEDIAQEAFVKAYYSLKKLKNEYAFSSWMTRIVTNLCYDSLKKSNRQTVMETEEMPTSLQSPIAQTDLKLTIREAMQKLSAEHRAVLVLRDIQGFSYDEIADRLEIPLGTVKSRINTARRELKNELSRDQSTNEN
ncbi:MAG TPA: sigma-70 family RNA polymerase sigma factor [Bacillales bacterium]|nr:sigma-70 family RNA polymerase sigma factor [Bacillales bacterium]